jgi:large subunit ribosomal protein L21
MYAIIKTGGKQYRVQKGDIIDIERLDVGENDVVTFDNVLAISDNGDLEMGTPSVKGALVTANLVANLRGRKVTVFKMKRRKGYRKKQGHRQEISKVKIDEIKKT